MRARCAGTLPAAEQLLNSVCREDLALTGLGVFWCWLFSLDINFSKHPGHVHAKSTARTAFGKSNMMLLPRFIGGAACEELGGARSKLWCFLNGNGAGSAQPALCWVELHHNPDPEPQVRNSTSLAGAAGSCSCITLTFLGLCCVQGEMASHRLCQHRAHSGFCYLGVRQCSPYKMHRVGACPKHIVSLGLPEHS